MNSLLLLAAIIVSLQCTFETNAKDIGNKLNNSLQPNVAAAPQRRRYKKNVVHISKAPPSRVTFEAGTKMVLECEVLGRPAPSVEWMKNGEPVIDYEEEINDILPAHPLMSAILVSKLIVIAAVSGDVFTCVATSNDKQDSASTTVVTVEGNYENDVLNHEEWFPFSSKPAITTYFDTAVDFAGSDIVLPCRVDSESHIFWKLNDEDVEENSKMRVLPSGDLLVTNLQWSDRGNFTCTAKNIYGKDTASTFVYVMAK